MFNSEIMCRPLLLPAKCIPALILLAAAFFGMSALGQPGPGFEKMVISPRPEPPAMAPTGQVAVLISKKSDAGHADLVNAGGDALDVGAI